MPNVTVEDANAVVRVTLGDINGDGSDYGLKVISSDGSTTIIDGNSDMFKIAASGTQTAAFPAAGSTNNTTTTLSGLGSNYTIPPQLLCLVTFDNAGALSNRIRQIGEATTFLNTGTTADWSAIAYTYLSGSPGSPIIALGAVSMALNPGTTAASRYYVLIEAGI